MLRSAIPLASAALLFLPGCLGKKMEIDHDGQVSTVAFSPDGKVLASGNHSGILCLRDAATGKTIRSIQAHFEDIFSVAVYSLAFSPDGKTLAAGHGDGKVRLWDPGRLKVLREFPGRVEVVRSVAFSPDGRLLASAGKDKAVIIWNAASGQQVRRLMGHEDSVSSVAFSPDGKSVASGGYDRTARLWDLTTGKELLQWPHQNMVTSVAFTPDGKRLACACYAGTIDVWELPAGKEGIRIKERQGGLYVMALSTDGKMIASSSVGDTAAEQRSNEQRITLWELATGEELAQWTAHKETIVCLTFSPDSKLLASGAKTGDGTIRLWDVATLLKPKLPK